MLQNILHYFNLQFDMLKTCSWMAKHISKRLITGLTLTDDFNWMNWLHSQTELEIQQTTSLSEMLLVTSTLMNNIKVRLRSVNCLIETVMSRCFNFTYITKFMSHVYTGRCQQPINIHWYYFKPKNTIINNYKRKIIYFSLSGIIKGDEIMVINGAIVSDLDMMYLESVLQEELSLVMMMRYFFHINHTDTLINYSEIAIQFTIFYDINVFIIRIYLDVRNSKA